MGIWQARSGFSLLAVLLTALFLLGTTNSAYAQVEKAPVWAVIEFENKGPKGTDIGKQAAVAIATEFSKRPSVDVLPVDVAMKTVETLGYRIPITQISQLSRLGLELEANTIVSGEVLNHRVVTDGADKFANVLVKVFVRDVQSGIIINGAAVSGKSGLRSTGTDDASLIAEAFGDAAFKAVSEVEARRLPASTVTSTVDGKALLDRGMRDGLSTNMNVIVFRGREQVSTGRITNVDNDSAVVTPTNGRTNKGIRSGDKVRVIFDVPDISPKFTGGGDAKVVNKRGKSNNSGLISLVLVLLLVAFLLGQGRSGSTDLVTRVTSQAIVDGADLPGVKVSWTRDTFLRHNNVMQFQVFRDDINTNPVAVTASGSQSDIVDRLDLANANNQYDATGLPILNGSTECFDDPGQQDAPATIVPLTPGRPYQYSVAVVYRVNFLDLPGQGSTNTGGTGTGGTGTGGTGTGGNNTGGNNTGGNNTGGNNTGGNGGSAEFCWFTSTRVAAKGLATPLNRPALRAPDTGTAIPATGNAAGRVNFQYTSVRGTSFGVSATLEYVIQVSPDTSFGSRTETVDKFVDVSTPSGSLVTRTSVDILSMITANSRVYWRVGVRNTEDDPGPVGSYIYSTARELRRAGSP